MEKIGVGIVGCGNISGIYLKNLTKTFQNVTVIAVSDLVEERAKKVCEEYGIPNICTTEELLNNSDIRIVLNLTTPKNHYDVCIAALNAGKHVYVEKPLSLTREDGAAINALAKQRGLLVGCAPDTFMGGGIQTCKKLIEDDWIGNPIAATAFMTCHGHESWHPDPEFYYKKGGGPMFDMGPYYITALVELVGKVESVVGETRTTFDQRTIKSEKKYGDIIKVEVPTHIAGLINFKNGALGTIITSFDIWGANLPRIEIHGTKGSISVPDPNSFGGEVKIKLSHHQDWQTVPTAYGFTENSRGIGVSDMAANLLSGTTDHKANGNLAYHVLDIMHAFHESAEQGKRIAIHS